VAFNADPPLTRGQQTAVFRIVQEALQNVIKHAGASNVWMQSAIEDDALVVSIRDDGMGLDNLEDRLLTGLHLGIAGMRARARQVGGTVRIGNATGGGAVVGDRGSDVALAHALGPEQATVEVQKLKGLGPFYASLVVVRASGFADALLQAPEPRLLGHVARLYELGEPPTLEKLTEIAEAWRPFRTWCTVLIRVAGDRAANGP